MTEVTQIKLVFECKDPLLVEHYEQKFGPRFRSEMAYWLQAGADTISWENLAVKWNTEMLTEAARQEHYDYDLDENGRRVLYYVDGKPVPLVPTVRVEPVAKELAL